MNWEEKITTYFTSKGALYIVSDEHKLLRHVTVQEALKKQHCHVHFYEDPVAFRQIYETTYRHLEKEQRVSFLIVIHHRQFNQIPYDVFEMANRITLSLDKLFPNLDQTVVKHCPLEMYQVLYSIQNRCVRPLQINETADFILREICGLEAAYLTDEKSIIKAAFYYYQQYDTGLPQILVERLKYILLRNNVFFSDDLFDCFTMKEHLIQMLNTQWQEFVNHYIDVVPDQAAEQKSLYGHHLFDDPVVRSRMFEFISPVEVSKKIDFEQWMLPGILRKEAENKLAVTDYTLFKDDYSHFGRIEWSEFADHLGKVQSQLLANSVIPSEFKSNVEKANTAFEQWMLSKYRHLRTLPVVPKPKVVHQIPHYLAKKLNRKTALLVLDGMSFTQWHVMKRDLQKKSWQFEESAVFSWVPSLTSVSRQSIFSGLEPRFFSETIGTTRKEKSLWESFWEKEGLSSQNVSYERSLGFKEYEKNELACNLSPAIRVYGAVIDVIDQFMHGATQGSLTVYSELITWLKSSYLHSLLTDLVQGGFDVYLTADHGNVECFGMGRIQQGVTVDSKGERVRIYSSSNIRNQTAHEHEETLVWDDHSLPSNYHVLLAKNNRAFVPKNDKIVTHGGIHLEEVIVPFVKVIGRE